MPKKLPILINQEEFELLLKAEKKKEYKVAYLLGFESGMRISEIIGLKESISKCCKADIITSVKELEGKDKNIKVYHCVECCKELTIKDMIRSKDKWLIKPLSKEQIDGVNIHIKGGKGQKDRIVPKPKQLTDKAIALLPLKINRRTFQKHLKQLGKKVLNKNISPHTLRHGFCSHLANSGMPLHQVQMLAGHSNLQTTGIYLHANPKQAIEKAQELF